MVAALAIRDAVGDAISRQQAAVKPGPWPGRRAAGEALSWDLVGPLGGHVHGRTFTWPHVVSVYLSTSGGLRQVYLYLRPPTPALPLPAPPPSEPRDGHCSAPLLRVARDREAQHARDKVARRDAVRVSCRVEMVPLVDLVEREDEKRRPRARRRGEERMVCR